MSSADQASEKNDVVANATPPADAPEALAQAGKDEKDVTKEAPSVEASEDTKGKPACQSPRHTISVIAAPRLYFLFKTRQRTTRPLQPTAPSSRLSHLPS